MSGLPVLTLPSSLTWWDSLKWKSIDKINPFILGDIQVAGPEKRMYVFSKCYCFLKDENETDVSTPPPTAALITFSAAADGGIQSYSPQLFWLNIYLWANGMHLSTFTSVFHPSVSKSK